MLQAVVIFCNNLKLTGAVLHNRGSARLNRLHIARAKYDYDHVQCK